MQAFPSCLHLVMEMRELAIANPNEGSRIFVTPIASKYTVAEMAHAAKTYLEDMLGYRWAIVPDQRRPYLVVEYGCEPSVLQQLITEDSNTNHFISVEEYTAHLKPLRNNYGPPCEGRRYNLTTRRTHGPARRQAQRDEMALQEERLRNLDIDDEDDE